MKESQHIEFKESWHDEYTRYVSAFCNTEGGVLYIGLNDNGTVIGVEHPEKLAAKMGLTWESVEYSKSSETGL